MFAYISLVLHVPTDFSYIHQTWKLRGETKYRLDAAKYTQHTSLYIRDIDG